MKIWDADTGTERRTIEGQSDWPQALAWSPDGRTLAVGRYDGTVSLYDAATGKRVGDPVRAPAATRRASRAARR